MSKPILYLSFDVETDGPSPTTNNLLSIGIAGFNADTKEIVFEFESNIMPIEGHVPDKKCMETFWLKPEQKEAYKYLQTNQRNYIDVFIDLSNKLKELDINYKLIWAAYPSCFDWMFFKSYYELAKSKCIDDDYFYDIGYQCKCISSTFDAFKKQMKLNSKQSKELYDELSQINLEEKNLHHALFDAKVQGKFYLGLLEKISQDKVLFDFSYKFDIDYNLLLPLLMIPVAIYFVFSKKN
jgi:hypothetical protein